MTMRLKSPLGLGVAQPGHRAAAQGGGAGGGGASAVAFSVVFSVSFSVHSVLPAIRC
jgi:hypothetical protein